MRNILKITVILSVMLLCSLTVVNAATKDELVAFASKTFTIAGQEVKLTDAEILKVQRYLDNNEVSEANADAIIAKVEKAIDVMDAEGVADPTKLSKEKKSEVLAIAQEAAQLAGATLTYSATDKVIVIYDKDGEKIEAISLDTNKFTQTGSNTVVYAVIATVAVIAVATVFGYRKIKANA